MVEGVRGDFFMLAVLLSWLVLVNVDVILISWRDSGDSMSYRVYI